MATPRALNTELAKFLEKQRELDTKDYTAHPGYDSSSGAALLAAKLSADSLGKKNDDGKAGLTRLGMVARALTAVAWVQEFGSRKYPSPDNWKHVAGGSKRYRDAALRHLFADLSGESHDPETGLTHLAHAACNLLIAAEHDMGFPEIARPAIDPVPEGAIHPHWRF